MKYSNGPFVIDKKDLWVKSLSEVVTLLTSQI